MLSAIVQLAGAVLLAILIFMRKEKDHYTMMTVVLPMIGEKSPKLLNAYKETWVIRTGLTLVIVGYVMQIVGLDINVIDMNNMYLKILFTIVSTLIVVVCGYFIAMFVANLKYKNAKPVSKKDLENEPGSTAYFSD